MRKIIVLLFALALVVPSVGKNFTSVKTDAPCAPCASGLPNRIVYFAYKWRKDTAVLTNGIYRTKPWSGFVKICDRHSAAGWSVLGSAIYPEWQVVEETMFLSK